MKKIELSDADNTLLWMACRYACSRQSIACTTLPMHIIKFHVPKMSIEQKRKLSEDLIHEINDIKRWGSESDLSWYKLAQALDDRLWIKVETINDNDVICIKVKEVVYPLNEYLKNPHCEVYLPPENIKQILS